MFESKLKNNRADLLAKAFLSLETEEDCYRLFEDLFTIREVQDLSSRMEIALFEERISSIDCSNRFPKVISPSLSKQQGTTLPSHKTAK